MKKMTLYIIILLFILSSVGACAKTHNGMIRSATVASVNGESITTDELAYFTGKLKAQVLNNYLQEYSVDYTPDFWSKEFGGKTPQQALNEQALEKCVMAKLQFVMMREEGIYSDISYQGLYDKALTFNKENSNKQGVVGLKSIKMEQFYSYYLDNGIMELRNILAKNEIKPTDKEIDDRVALLMADSRDFGESDLKSIATTNLIAEKYEAYIADKRKSTEVEIF